MTREEKTTAPRLTYLILSLGTVLSIGFMAWAGEPASAAWWWDLLPWIGWVLLPYAMIGAAARVLWRAKAAQWVLFAGALLVGLISAVALPYALLVDVRDQSGLVFLGLPMWQIPAAGLFVVVAAFVGLRRASRRAADRSPADDRGGSARS